jgi:DNA primase
LRKAGKEYVGGCPFHEDHRPSLCVNQEKQLFHCFSCHRKGDLINFIMQIENLDTKQACLFLGT